MSGLLPDKVLNIFSHNPAYEHDGFKMWVHILEKYDPRGKGALFESVFALYTLDKTQYKSIGDYISRVICLFSGLHGINFNTMENLFIVVNSDRFHFGALAYRFSVGNPGVINTDVNRL